MLFESSTLSIRLFWSLKSFLDQKLTIQICAPAKQQATVITALFLVLRVRPANLISASSRERIFVTIFPKFPLGKQYRQRRPLFLVPFSVAARISENHHGPRPPPGSPLEMPLGDHGSPAAQQHQAQGQLLPYLEEIKAGEFSFLNYFSSISQYWLVIRKLAYKSSYDKKYWFFVNVLVYTQKGLFKVFMMLK